VLRTILAAAVAFLLMATGAFSQDGARAYHLVPQGTDIVSLTMNVLHTEEGGSVVDVGVLTPSFRTAIDVGGNAGSILIGMPIGSLSASIDTGMGIIEQHNDPAQGDLFIGAQLGLIGSPSLAPMEFAQYKPGFRLGVATKLFLPTGDYDSSRIVNLGGNRWSLQASLPMTYVLADSMIDPNMTTFELVPMVHIFGDNNEPFGGADVLSQAPIFVLDGHITHNFSSTVWASLDGAYLRGGERSMDGFALGDDKEVVSLGATLGLVLSPSFALRMRYDEVVYSKAPDAVGRGLEVSASYTF